MTALSPARKAEIEAVYAHLDGAFPINEMAAAIRDLLAELRRREWQPIETAPKDGTWFLWGQPEGNPHCCVIRWPEYRECWTAPGSHWQPLPEPPSDD